jgi:hypothetical protein
MNDRPFEGTFLSVDTDMCLQMSDFCEPTSANNILVVVLTIPLYVLAEGILVHRVFFYCASSCKTGLSSYRLLVHKKID